MYIEVIEIANQREEEHQGSHKSTRAQEHKSTSIHTKEHKSKTYLRQAFKEDDNKNKGAYKHDEMSPHQGRLTRPGRK